MNYWTLGFKLFSSGLAFFKLHHRSIMGALVVLGLLIFIAMPDVVFGFLLESAHLLFELVESALDKVIEHAFHTDLHLTQIIVFYILAGIVLLVIYYLYHVLPLMYQHWKEDLSTHYLRLKIHTGIYWHEMTVLHKIYACALTGLVLLVMYFLFLG